MSLYAMACSEADQAHAWGRREGYKLTNVGPVIHVPFYWCSPAGDCVPPEPWRKPIGSKFGWCDEAGKYDLTGWPPRLIRLRKGMARCTA